MNFKEICEFVAEEVNGRPLTFSTVLLTSETDPFKRKVIRTVNQAYMDIQLHSRFWRFLDKRGALLSVKEDVSEYRMAQVQSVDWNSLYLTQSGSTSRWPVYPEPLEHWKYRERFTTETDGIPLTLSRAKDPDLWRLWPTPLDDYVLNGNLQYKPGELEQSCDEPIWDEAFHEMLCWQAVRQLEARVKTQDEVVSSLNTSQAQKQFNTRWANFCAQYLPRP